MKKRNVLKFSKEIIRDIELIAKYEKIKSSDLINSINYNFNVYIQLKKNKIIKNLEGTWLLDKISTEQFKKLTGSYPSKILRREKDVWKKNADLYKDNARKALLMNFCEH